MATSKQATEAVAYVAHAGNKALAGTNAKVIAAQHVAAATKAKGGVPFIDLAVRAIAVGFDLRAVGYVRPDATYSTRNTPAASRNGAIGAVHTFAHASALPKGAPLACDALHKGASGPCKAIAPNDGKSDARTYRLDSCDGFDGIVAILDAPDKLRAAAAAAFEALVRSAVASGYSDAARLAATQGIAQMLEHPTYGDAMRKAFAKATANAKAPRAPRVRRPAPTAPVAPIEPQAPDGWGTAGGPTDTTSD